LAQEGFDSPSIERVTLCQTGGATEDDLIIERTAFLWFGITLIHHRRTRTTSTAWLFALVPIAFFEPALLADLWFSSLHSGK
jgi:hypothetical protein